jgi:hypothetical protein
VIQVGAWSGFVREHPNAVYQKAQGAVTAKGLELKVAIPGASMTAEGGRAYRLVVLIILVILIWPVALIYYFTRKRNSLTLQIQPHGEGSQVQINAFGEKADDALGMITSGLTAQ